MISRTTNNLRVWPLLASARSSAAVVMSTDSGKSDQVDGSNSSFSNRLRFDNRALAVLPVERNQSNYVRGVSNSIFSRVKPTPLSTPKLVIYSGSAIRLLDLTDEDTQTDEFVQHFAGNRLWTGSDPASQCYCGHQVSNCLMLRWIMPLYVVFFMLTKCVCVCSYQNSLVCLQDNSVMERQSIWGK